MNKSLLMMFAAVLGAALPLSACGGNGQDAARNVQQQNRAAPMNATNDGGGNAAHPRDAGVIPNYHGPKTDTTNERGGTTSGMGMSVYSMIGSSGLHEGGVSSHIESRIAGQGIDDIEVFVIDDTVVLAAEKSGIVTNQYDALQNEVLSPTQGMSGKGAPYEGTKVQRNAAEDNLTAAKRQVEQMFDGHVRIVAVTEPKAVELIRRIQSKLSASVAGASVAGDIASLLDLAKE